MDINTIAAEVLELREAHRALAAQHDALLMTCKAMLPLIDVSPATAKRLLFSVFETKTESMEDQGHDNEYQAQVCHTLNQLSELIVSAADMRATERSGGESGQ